MLQSEVEMYKQREGEKERNLGRGRGSDKERRKKQLNEPSNKSCKCCLVFLCLITVVGMVMFRMVIKLSGVEKKMCLA